MSFRRSTPPPPPPPCPGGCPHPMQGFGDLVARATNALGIPACGPCAERQARLNALFPFGRPR
jgi:hypothetical protein